MANENAWVRFSLETSRSAAEVFASVADFARLAEWDPFVSHSELVSGEPMTAGARYRLEGVGGLSLSYEIVEIEAPTRVVYRGGTKRVTSTDTINVESDNENTEVTVVSVLRFSGWTRLISPLMLGLLWAGGRFLSIRGMKRRLRTTHP